MKLNVKVLKNPKFIIGAIVLFVVVLWMLNRSGGSSATVSASPAPGSTDHTVELAQLQAALGNAQLAAGLQATQDTNATQIALAEIAANAGKYNTDASAQIAALGISMQSHEADLAAQISALGIGAQVHAADLQYQTNIATITAATNQAQMAYNYAAYALGTNAALESHIADNQLTAYEFGTIASLHGNEQYRTIAYAEGVMPSAPVPKSNGFNPIAFVSPVAALVSLS
jgi:hypothetical protein